MPPKPTSCATPTSNEPATRAELARRRYLAVDPGNRLVAATLEADWNEALRQLTAAAETSTSAAAPRPAPLTDERPRPASHALASGLPRPVV